MANYNRVILAGHLTRDPELRYTPSGAAVCQFDLAVNRKWRAREQNEEREEVLFIECVCFARTAEAVSEHLHKGSACLVEGFLRLEKWTGKDKIERSKIRAVAESIQFLDGKDRDRQG